MNIRSRASARPHAILCLLASASLFAGAASADARDKARAAPPVMVPAVRTSEPVREVVVIPMPLPLPGQLKPVPAKSSRPEPADPRQRVGRANAAARVQPDRSGYLNAIQQYAFTEGALYQVYAAPGQVTDIMLQEGEELIGPGPVAAGDTARWIIGDTVSGSGTMKRVHILAKPTRADIATNLVINTNRRTYHLELHATASTYMAAVSWTYPQDALIALRTANAEAERLAPVASGIDIAGLNFRYRIAGDKPAWRPVRVFDDGRQLFIEFPEGIATAEMPPLFVTGDGDAAELVNYRVQGRYMVVDRLFAAGELRLGTKQSEQRVRVERDERPAGAVMSGPEREQGERPDAEQPELEAPDALPAAVEPAHIAPPIGNPAELRLQGDPPRVMRLSRKALATIGVAAGLGIGGSLIYALQPARHQAPENLYGTSSANKADVVTGAPASYDKVPRLGAPMPGDLGRPILSAQQRGEVVPVPPMRPQGAAPVDPRIAAAEQARQRAMQERDSARTSTLFLGGNQSGRETLAAADAIPMAAMVTPSLAAAAAPQALPTGQAAKGAFLAGGDDRATISAARLTAPVSPYVVQAGSIIPAALITGIRSDLPGQITAQVTQNVYDSPTGRILLIPQGSRLIGEYDSEVSAGQNRVLLAWDRLILPGGRSILLDRQPGADASGMAGLQDRTNYHWGNMLKAALISTLLGAGTQLVAEGDDELTRAIRYGTQDTINQTGRQVVQRQLNVPPTLTIRPGHPLRVIVTRDMVLEPVAEGGRP